MTNSIQYGIDSVGNFDDLNRLLQGENGVNGRSNPLKIQFAGASAHQPVKLNQAESLHLDGHSEPIEIQGNSMRMNTVENSALKQSVQQPTELMEHSLSNNPTTIEQPSSESSSSWRWLFTALVLCCAVGGLATLAFVWLTSLPPRTNCGEISPLSPDIDRLYCAQAAAESGELDDLMTGLKLVEAWSPDHPLYNESRRWMKEWSQSVLVIARQKMAASDMETAIELANRIPNSSPLYAEAQSAIAQWQENWQIDEAIYAKAQTALKNQDWDSVSHHILELSESPYDYWNTEKVNELAQQVLSEKKARQILAQAKRTAEVETPDNLQAALKLAKTLDTTTYTWMDAQPTLTQWGNTLLTIGFDRWREKRFDEAIAHAEAASVSSALATEAQHLIDLSQARQLALASGGNWKPQPKHVWNLMEAVSAAKRIPSTSRFYAQAQESLASWDAQLQATSQLQVANLLADLGQRDSLQTAIAQAEQIPPAHPRRLQAQTLIAYWKQEVQRVEDQPYLLFAQQLAEAGTVADLKLAIAEASKIEAGRVLRHQAQGLIYDWTQQIQVLEDQPLLAEATTQAQQGNLTDAIRIAAQIPADRALYDEAQAAIAGWQAELNRIEIARTRPARSNESNVANTPDSSYPTSSAQADPESFDWVQTPTVAKTAKDERPVTPPSPQLTPVLPPQETTRQPELAPPSPFVLQESAPLYEEEPAARFEYRSDGVPRLIRRHSHSSDTPASVVNEPPAIREVFPPLDDATLFEEPPEVAPALESIPVEAEPVVEELPSGTESSAIESLLPSESSQLEESVPLSVDSINKNASDEISEAVEQSYPVSMNVSENEIELNVEFSDGWN
ncbi:HlyD family secretion protein [Thermocoleostomius sinensis]|uniref:Chromosome segregation ATPase n=1 Tax=Thermocoleostomius sinensis A174 TaxID=2016057 RepID=A0A9E8ZHS5_9CYAN|nr:hypothetical protein [Thermocoleostomius sinensis]WAL61455.1 hypothetical protein OXH18_05545 [Thermocoleostomius sinensis A174]